MPIVPTIVEKSQRGERVYDIFSRLLEERIIFLAGPITDMNANVVIAQMLYLVSKDPKKDIKLYINSPGGSVTAGLAIYDTMQYIKCRPFASVWQLPWEQSFWRLEPKASDLLCLTPKLCCTRFRVELKVKQRK